MAAKPTKTDTPAQLPKTSTDFTRALAQQTLWLSACEKYDGPAGFYAFGTAGTELIRNVLLIWRKFFIINDKMCHVSTPLITPSEVLVASGHAQKFTDTLVCDKGSGEWHRADLLIENFCRLKIKGLIDEDPEADVKEFKTVLDKINKFSTEELGGLINQYEIVAPDTKNPLSTPELFHLMFPVKIGYTGSISGYLRPETAQGIFVEFKKLFKEKPLPFSCGQCGKVFRNEKNPKNGLIRVREFTLAEVEHFTDPNDKSHKKFHTVSNLKILLETRDDKANSRNATRHCIKEAVENGIIGNECLGYFMGKAHQFLVSIGIKEDKIKFRQHLSTELAHYSIDTWDGEVLLSLGWVEVLGISDRHTHDMIAHNIEVQSPSKRLKFSEVLMCKPKYFRIKEKYHEEVIEIMCSIKLLKQEEMELMVKDLKSEGSATLKLSESKKVLLDMSMIKFETKRLYDKVNPAVIEAGFGMGRIVYALCEHNFKCDVNSKEVDAPYIFKFLPSVAPFKCAVVPVAEKENLLAVASRISDGLANEADLVDISFPASKSMSGKCRMADAAGLPYLVIVDSELSAAVRERDTQKQIRISVGKVVEIIMKLLDGSLTWDEAVLENSPAELEMDPASSSSFSFSLDNSNNHSLDEEDEVSSAAGSGMGGMGVGGGCYVEGVIEFADSYVIKVHTSGLVSSDFMVQLDGDSILLIGAVKQGMKFLQKFPLRDNANTDDISATCKDGLLTVTIKKFPQKDLKSIPVVQVV